MWSSALLPLLLLLLAPQEVTLAQQSDLFVSRQVQHASTPLRTAQVSSVVCAAFCLRTPDCLKWSRDPATGECRLLPLHSADNPLTAESGHVHQRPHPPGYVPMPGGGVAYRPHARLTQAGPVLIQLCREEDPEAMPAFITTDAQFNFLMTLPFPYPYQWLSTNDLQEEGVYKDLSNTTIVDITEWISPVSALFHNKLLDGVLFAAKYGLMNRAHTNKYSYLCEYWM